MNERIKELAEQAGLAEAADVRDGYIYPAGMKKFAELIVKECMSMSDKLKAEYLGHRKSTSDFSEKNIYAEGEAACNVLQHRMKKHFGVEE